MNKLTCFVLAAVLANCLALYPLPTKVYQAPYLDLPKPAVTYGVPHEVKYEEKKAPVITTYTYEIPHTPIKPAEVYGVPKVEIKTYPAPTPVKPAAVYGVPVLEKTHESAYKYILTDTPVGKPAEVYGVPSKPAEVYGVPVIVHKPESTYKYIIKETPVVKPAEIYGVPHKPAVIYGVPEVYKPIVKQTNPISSSYKYTLIDTPKVYTVPKPYATYGPPKVEIPVVPAKVYGVPKYEEKKTPVITTYKYEVPNVVVKPYAPPKPAVVYGVPEEKVTFKTTKPVLSTYTYRLPETVVPIKPAEVYGVPHTTYGVPH